GNSRMSRGESPAESEGAAVRQTQKDNIRPPCPAAGVPGTNVNIAYFTAGNIGAGHLVRALAIRRGLLRAGFHGSFRIFGPPLPFPAARGIPDVEEIAVQGDRSYGDRFLAPASPLAARLHAFAPDLLLVDLFWAPVYWILPALPCPAWLLLRL